MENIRRITQRDIARQAGVHRSTVSLVFKNDPVIPAATRERVLKVARELGYSPDPMLSALAAYRSRHRKTTFHGSLAWIAMSTDDFHWKESVHFSGYYKGAAARAEKHGYTLNVFDGLDASPRRIASILRARNIEGVLVCPQPVPNAKMDFLWEDFSLLTFGYTLVSPRLHLVAAAHYQHMLQCLKELSRLGYRKIGLVSDPVHDERINHLFVAAYLAHARLSREFFEVPPFLDHYHGKSAALARWLRETGVDCIVTGDCNILDTLSAMGIKVPSQLGVACVGLSESASPLSGMVEDSEEIGQVATDFLVAMIQRGERGLPESPHRVIVEGRWVPGSTVRPRKA